MCIGGELLKLRSHYKEYYISNSEEGELLKTLSLVLTSTKTASEP